MSQNEWMKGNGQVRKGRRAGEEQGGYSCGMCDEQGHESGAGEAKQNNNFHTLHQSAIVSHPNSECVVNKEMPAHTHTHSSRPGLSIGIPVSFVLGSPVEMYTV